MIVIHCENWKGLRQGGWRFYVFIAVGGARLMCVWDSSRKASTPCSAICASLPAKSGESQSLRDGDGELTTQSGHLDSGLPTSDKSGHRVWNPQSS